MKQKTIYCSDLEAWACMKKYCADNNMSVSYFIMRAIRAHLSFFKVYDNDVYGMDV